MARLKKDREHLVFNFKTGSVQCLNCGQFYKPQLPCPVEMFASILKTFGKLHRGCKKI